MIATPEDFFRQTEVQLDQLLAIDAKKMIANDISIRDESSREYHYKCQHLQWRHVFERRWSLPPEIAAMRLTVAFSEPIDASSQENVVLTTVLEIFQLGQESRWKEADVERMPVDNLKAAGFGQLLKERVELAKRAINTQSGWLLHESNNAPNTKPNRSQ